LDEPIYLQHKEEKNMNIFSPFATAFRVVNTISTAYFCGKIGIEVYKHVRSMQKEILTARKLRDRFVTEYTIRKGQPPTEEEIQIAIASYNAIERPVLHWIHNIRDKIAGADK
jgi:hypothetical protein